MVLIFVCMVGGAAMLMLATRDGDHSESLPDADLTQLDSQPLALSAVKPVAAHVSESQATPAPVQAPVKTPVAAAPVSRPTDPVVKPDDVAQKVAITPVRSPYPMPGEQFDKPLAPTLLVSAEQASEMASAGQLQAQPGQIIDWDHARQYVGQTITVEGKVVLANKTKTVCFLNFTKDWHGRFYVILFEGVLGGWPQSPDKYFLNKTIQVTGEVKERKGVPQIQVTRTSQVKVIDHP